MRKTRIKVNKKRIIGIAVHACKNYNDIVIKLFYSKEAQRGEEKESEKIQKES